VFTLGHVNQTTAAREKPSTLIGNGTKLLAAASVAMATTAT